MTEIDRSAALRLHGERSLTMATISEHLADFAAAVVAGHAPEPVLRMRLYALDTLAVTLAGTVSPSSAPVLRTILASAGKPEATVMTAGRATSAWDAALANGAFAHALELDDDHRIAVLHPGAAVVPAALAAAEAAGATGLTFLRALLVGYEVACRLGEVYRGSLFDHGLHPDVALRHAGHGRRGCGRDGSRPRRVRARARHCRNPGLGSHGVAGGRLLDQAPASRPRGACAAFSPRASRARASPAPPPSSRAMEASSAPSRTARRSIPKP